MYVVGYTLIGGNETIKHREYATKQEAIESAEALALASVSDETIEQVLRGTKLYDDVVDYNVLHEIHR